jgi:hypothetical protein
MVAGTSFLVQDTYTYTLLFYVSIHTYLNAKQAHHLGIFSSKLIRHFAMGALTYLILLLRPLRHECPFAHLARLMLDVWVGRIMQYQVVCR